jgi:hypothetical protein
MQAQPWVTAIAAIAVVLVWGASLVVGAIENDWTPLTITTPVMLLFGSYAFGVTVIRRQRNGDNDMEDRWSGLP